ncbi:MAG TPA: hypothetical protein VEL74_07190 [Thermoanaerobaculia bacterium]|nr:hypothetical protein [Thermoanaerobaculia bacterium]
MNVPPRPKPPSYDPCLWLGSDSHPFHALAQCAADLYLARLRIEKLATDLESHEFYTSRFEDHEATDPIAEMRRAIRCVVQDRLTPAIQELYDFILHPLDGPGEAP